jgi:uncharacterized membrane protein
MDGLLIALRLIHISAGVFWVGAAALYLGFIEPTAKATAPESGKFMQYFMVQRRYSMAMSVATTLTVVSGAWLYWRTSGGFQWAWLSSGPGLGFGLGAIAALISYVVGAAVIGPTGNRISALGQAMHAAGGPPSAEQLAEMGAAQRKMSTVLRYDFVLLTVALFAMATARYWWF